MRFAGLLMPQSATSDAKGEDTCNQRNVSECRCHDALISHHTRTFYVTEMFNLESTFCAAPSDPRKEFVGESVFWSVGDGVIWSFFCVRFAGLFMPQSATSDAKGADNVKRVDLNNGVYHLQILIVRDLE